MGMQGEMSPAGTGGLFFRVFSSDEHPPPPRCVCACLSVLGCVVLQMELGTTSSVQWACKADEETSTNIDFL